MLIINLLLILTINLQQLTGTSYFRKCCCCLNLFHRKGNKSKHNSFTDFSHNPLAHESIKNELERFRREQANKMESLQMECSLLRESCQNATFTKEEADKMDDLQKENDLLRRALRCMRNDGHLGQSRMIPSRYSSGTSLIDTNDFLERLEVYRNGQRYGWKTFIFNNFNLAKECSYDTRKLMLISINVHYATLTSPQIDDFLAVIDHNGIISTSAYLTSNYRKARKYSQNIQLFFSQIPTLYRKNDIRLMNERIATIFRIFVPELIKYFSHYFEKYSNDLIQYTNKLNLKSVDKLKYLKASPSKQAILLKGQLAQQWELFQLYNTTDMIDRDILSKQLQGNSNETEEILFENAKIKDLEAMSHNIFGTLFGWICSLQSVAELIENEEKAIKIRYSKFPLEEFILNNHLKQQINSVFPDIDISLTSSFYHHKKLSHSHDTGFNCNFWDVPVQFVRLMAIKILLYTRRNVWGNKELLRLQWNAEHVIKNDPLEIVLRISLKDNMLPIMQRGHLQKLQAKIDSDYQYLIRRDIEFVENFRDNEENKEEWLNNVFLLTSIIISELNGTFGVVNHYNGSGTIESSSELLLPKKEFFIEIPLRKENDITQQDIDEMIENGKIKNTFEPNKTVTDWGVIYKMWLGLELEQYSHKYKQNKTFKL